jgi:eukaryotic-like serine/threonine-protein kinase
MDAQHLATYRIQSRLGAGGMGEVYRAHDTKLGRDVALKVLPSELASNPERKQRLLREARAAASLNHPNICTIHDVGEADGHAYIAMEVIDGEPLSKRIASGPLSIEDLVRYGTQLADALAHAHQRGVVHRDLKSANVMITPEGRVKVLDFGLAKLLSGDDPSDLTTRESLSGSGAVLGTLPYMAPEQLRGQPVDARADIWALGVVLYEMASGTRPFAGTTAFELSSAILNHAPPPLPARVATELHAVTNRCLQKEQARRYQAASEVGAALDVLSTQVLSGRLLTGAPRAGRRAPLAAVVAIVIACAAGAAIWFNRAAIGRLFGGAGRNIQSIAVLPLENLSGDPQQEYFATGMHEALITDLARIGIQKIIAKPSADAYKGTRKALRDVGRELGVDGLLTGAVMRSGSRVQLTAQLVRAETGEVMWANRFESNAADILTLQNDLVSAIAREVRAKINPEQSARLAKSRQVDPAAHDAYLRGRSMYSQMTAGAVDAPRFDAIVAEFEKAARIDSTYAAPQAALAGMYQMASQTSMLPSSDVAPKGKAAALKAIELDDGLADAHAALGGVLLWHDWDWAGAEREIKRALEINPDSVDALVASQTHALLIHGRVQEAEATSRRILSLDPLNPFSRIQRIWIAFFSRNVDEVIPRANSLLEVWPGAPMATFFRGQAYALKHMGQEASDDCSKTIAATAGGFKLQTTAMCAWALGIAGRTDEARRLVRILEQPPQGLWVDPAVMGVAYGGVGDIDRAVEWFEKAFEERSPNMIYMKQGPPQDFARSDPRFQALLKRMNFPG